MAADILSWDFKNTIITKHLSESPSPTNTLEKTIGFVFLKQKNISTEKEIFSSWTKAQLWMRMCFE